jgi:hypothetical protein
LPRFFAQGDNVQLSLRHHLDEAVSVFLHFNSKLMKNSSVNSWKLGCSFANVSATYFVDAALDTTFMSNIVNYFQNGTEL